MSHEDSRWSPFILPPVSAKFRMGDHVENISGVGWRGRVVGFYFTDLTPIGYAVESDAHSGKMQICPERALRLVEPAMSKLSDAIEPISGFKPTISWPDPTDEMIASPEFEAVWQAIKTWDINSPLAYDGYCRATGNHVRHILDALRCAHETGASESSGR